MHANAYRIVFSETPEELKKFGMLNREFVGNLMRRELNPAFVKALYSKFQEKLHPCINKGFTMLFSTVSEHTGNTGSTIQLLANDGMM